MKRAIGYARVSTEDQGLSLEAQHAELTAWCARHGVELVTVLEDHGVSGAAPLDKRPGLVAALAELRSSRADVLLVVRRDRLARDPFVAGMVEREAARYGARVLSATEAPESADSPEAALLRGVQDAVAAYERALLRARTKAALQAKRRKGERVGQIPFGYQLAEDGVRLVEHPGEQRAIALVRELRSTGLSQRAIVAHLNAHHIDAARGRAWHLPMIQRLLKAA
jgi:DNA invertase Pin-like site-specific DNA recombinase